MPDGRFAMAARPWLLGRNWLRRPDSRPRCFRRHRPGTRGRWRRGRLFIPMALLPVPMIRRPFMAAFPDFPWGRGAAVFPRSRLFGRWERFSFLQVIKQRGRHVRGTEALLEQTRHERLLLLEISPPERLPHFP